VREPKGNGVAERFARTRNPPVTGTWRHPPKTPARFIANEER
jgi:hypothetical protein